MSRFLIEDYQGLEAYTPGEQPRDMQYIKLNTNESPYPPSAGVLNALSSEEVSRLNLYPDPECKELKDALATLYGVGRENVFLSRTIEVQENQKVIDTGLYGIVRHPMYTCTILLFLSMPLVLGSLISFVIMMAYIPIIAGRIRNEEQVLENGLEGYRDYKRRVRYKVIPYLW